MDTFGTSTEPINTTDTADKDTDSQKFTLWNRDMNDGQVLHLQQMIICKVQPFFSRAPQGTQSRWMPRHDETWSNLDPQHVEMWILSSIWSVFTHTFACSVQNKCVGEWVNGGILWLAQVQSEYITFHLVAQSMLRLHCSPSAGKVHFPKLATHRDELSKLKWHVAWGWGYSWI